MFHRKTRGILPALAGLLLVAATFAPALALTPVQQNADHEIHLPAYDLSGHRSLAADLASREAELALTERYGGPWRVLSWNPQSHTPRLVQGSARLAPGVRDAGDLADRARAVVRDNASLLRVDPAQLELRATPSARGKWVAHFQQTWRGLEVWSARVRVAFADDGRLLLMGSDCHDDIDLDPAPSLTAAEAAAIATADLPFDPATDSIDGEPELMVLPYPVSETKVEHRLVWRLRVRTDNPLGIWVTSVDAHDGAILWRTNDIHFAHGGGSEAEVQRGSYCSGTSAVPVPHLRVIVSGLGTAYTDAAGDWSLAGGSGSYSVSADLYGPYVDIYNFGGDQALFTGTVDDGAPLTVRFDEANSQRDERDSFDAVNLIHDFFQGFAPEYAYVNGRMLTRVSRTDYYCPGNAWFDGSSINMCAAGGSYANTGEIQGVVEHEYGHGVQADLIGYQGEQGLGEGNADILANLITQDPVIGRGFYAGNCSGGIRSSDNNLVYPEDVIGQPIHSAGRVIAGFNWDAMELLQARYGQEQGTLIAAANWHYGRLLLQPTTQPDQVYATFFADDDDGNLDNGTPHYDIYCEAAGNHGFDCPEILAGVFISHAPHPYSGQQAGDYIVEVQTQSLGGGMIDPASVALHYRVDGGAFQAVPMAGGNPNQFTAAIPNQAYGSVVEYYVEAANDLGATGTSPQSAPSDLHYFEVGDRFTEDMETETAWIAGADDDTASSGRWERADPQATTAGGGTAQPENDHTPAGALCWITGAAAGSSAGSYDVDNGKTTLFSPVFDLAGADAASVTYWKWYTDNLGGAPDADVWRVDVSNDGGQTWTGVEQTSDDTTEWTQVSVNLLAVFPALDRVQFRFVASDTGEGSLVEAGVDDFVLVASFDMTDVDDGLSLAFPTALAQNHPNPFNPRTEIRFSLETAGPARLRVYDARGRVVKVLADGPRSSGEHAIIWDGTDAYGKPVASGVYFYRLETDERSISKRMVLLK